MVKIVNCNLIKITILTIYPKDVKLFMRKVIRSMKYICFISKFYIELCEGSDTYMKKIYETIQEDILRKVQQGIYSTRRYAAKREPDGGNVFHQRSYCKTRAGRSGI